MKHFRCRCWVILLLFSAGLGCGQKAVVPTGPIEAPKKPPTTVPMMGPKLPHSQGK